MYVYAQFWIHVLIVQHDYTAVKMHIFFVDPFFSFF
jgi:hypothetical protein